MFVVAPAGWVFNNGSMFCGAALGVISNHLAEKETADCFILFFVVVCDLCFFFTMPRFGLQSVIGNFWPYSLLHQMIWYIISKTLIIHGTIAEKDIEDGQTTW